MIRCLRPGVAAACLVLGLAAAGPPVGAAEKLVFGTNWKAEAEHGGFYQALAEGRYAKVGLDVEIREGGPMVNVAHMLAAGAIDAAMIANNAQAINFLRNDIPMVTIAAFFQKDPAVLIAHPGGRLRTIAAMKGRPIMISAETARGLVALPSGSNTASPTARSGPTHSRWRRSWSTSRRSSRATSPRSPTCWRARV